MLRAEHDGPARLAAFGCPGFVREILQAGNCEDKLPVVSDPRGFARTNDTEMEQMAVKIG